MTEYLNLTNSYICMLSQPYQDKKLVYMTSCAYYADKISISTLKLQELIYNIPTLLRPVGFNICLVYPSNYPLPVNNYIQPRGMNIFFKHFHEVFGSREFIHFFRHERTHDFFFIFCEFSS